MSSAVGHVHPRPNHNYVPHSTMSVSAITAPSVGGAAPTQLRWRDKQKGGFGFSRRPRAELEAKGLQADPEDGPVGCRGLSSRCRRQTVAEVISLVPRVGGGTILTRLASPSWGPSPPQAPEEGALLYSEDVHPDPGSWPGVRSWLSQRRRGGVRPTLRPRCLAGLGLRARGRELCRNEMGTLGNREMEVQLPAAANLGSLLLFSGD